MQRLWGSVYIWYNIVMELCEGRCLEMIGKKRTKLKAIELWY